MKHFFKKIWQTPMFLIFVLIGLFYGIPSLGNPAEINRFAIVTAVGIDKAEQEDFDYEVSLLTFVPVPEQTFTEFYKVISASGNSIEEALDYAGLYTGRQVGLSHIKTIVLSEDLFDEDVTKVLDYLMKDKEVSSSTKLIAMDGKAKDFLNAVKDLDSQSSYSVSEIVAYNEHYIYATGCSLEAFFKGYFSPTKASIVPVFSLQSSDDEGISTENGGGGGETSSGGSDGKSGGQGGRQIVNNGDAIVFKNGEKQKDISGDDIVKINYFRGEFKTGGITIEDFNGEPFGKASLSFDISGKKLRNKVVFENGIPTIYTDIKFTVTLSEVEQEDEQFNKDVDLYNVTKNETSQIEKQIKREMAEALEIMREAKTDVANFYTLMYNTDKKSFKRFLDSLDDKEDYLRYTLFKTSVRVHSK